MWSCKSLIALVSGMRCRAASAYGVQSQVTVYSGESMLCVTINGTLYARSHIRTGCMMGKGKASSALRYGFNAHDAKMGKASWRGTETTTENKLCVPHCPVAMQLLHCNRLWILDFNLVTGAKWDGLEFNSFMSLNIEHISRIQRGQWTCLYGKIFWKELDILGWEECDGEEGMTPTHLVGVLKCVRFWSSRGF